MDIEKYGQEFRDRYIYLYETKQYLSAKRSEYEKLVKGSAKRLAYVNKNKRLNNIIDINLRYYVLFSKLCIRNFRHTKNLLDKYGINNFDNAKKRLYDYCVNGVKVKLTEKNKVLIDSLVSKRKSISHIVKKIGISEYTVRRYLHSTGKSNPRGRVYLRNYSLSSDELCLLKFKEVGKSYIVKHKDPDKGLVELMIHRDFYHLLLTGKYIIDVMLNSKTRVGLVTKIT